jgi:hypothetical protein
MEVSAADLGDGIGVLILVIAIRPVGVGAGRTAPPVQLAKHGMKGGFSGEVYCPNPVIARSSPAVRRIPSRSLGGQHLQKLTRVGSFGPMAGAYSDHMHSRINRREKVTSSYL